MLAQHHLGPAVGVVGREGHGGQGAQLLPLHPLVHHGRRPLTRVAGILGPQGGQIRHIAAARHRGAQRIGGEREPEQTGLPLIAPRLGQRLVEPRQPGAILQPDPLGQGGGEGVGITPPQLVAAKQALEFGQGRQTPWLLAAAARRHQRRSRDVGRGGKALPRQPELAALDPGGGTGIVQTVPGPPGQQAALLIQSQQLGGLRLLRHHGTGRIELQPGGLDGLPVAAAIPVAGGAVVPQGQQHLPTVGIVELGPQPLGSQQGRILLHLGLLLQADLAGQPPLRHLQHSVSVAIRQQEERRLLLVEPQGGGGSAPGPGLTGREIRHPGRAGPQYVSLLLPDKLKGRRQQQASRQRQGRVALTAQDCTRLHAGGALAQAQGSPGCQPLADINGQGQLGPGMGLLRGRHRRGDRRRDDGRCHRRRDNGRGDRHVGILALAAVVMAGTQDQQAGQQEYGFHRVDWSGRTSRRLSSQMPIIINRFLAIFF